MIDIRQALRLYLVADPEHANGDLVQIVDSAIRGGVTMVQLRAKSLTDRDLLECARQLRGICSTHEVPFLLNDRLDIALAAGADGVHLGVDDLPTEDVRRITGADFIIGYSPETEDQIQSARNRSVDYLGIGPVFATSTKSDAGDALGIDEFSRRFALGGLPAVGIGGITASNASQVLDTGANGVAVVSAVLGAANPEAAANQLSRNS